MTEMVRESPSEVRYNYLFNLPVVVPHILEACPELDADGVLELIKEKTRLNSLHPEDVQTIRALVLRLRLSAR